MRNIPKYQTTGILTKPLVVLQTSGDPIVPAWHATEYDAKVPATNYDFSVEMVNRYGHCNFTSEEMLAAFTKLGGYITNSNIALAETQLAPEQKEAFYKQLRDEGKIK